jgi:2-polyprenyl-3-methyl-5-hydroxy-6-metoxy-1,4-benzoquinol methylase
MNKKFYLKVKDHSVSGEWFELYHDLELDLLATVPQPLEIGRYYESDDYISHTDAKRSLFEKAYHAVKKVALKRKVNLLDRKVIKGTLLDIGAGTGDFLYEAKRDGWATMGTEPNTGAAEIAKSKGVELITSTAGLETYSFDAITMWHVLEHVPDPSDQLRELKRLIKPNGTIFIAVPNFKSRDAVVYGPFWAAYDVPRHLWHFSETAISKLASQVGLELTETLPMPFDAYYVSLLSEKYKTGKMNPFRAFRNGFISNLKGRKTGQYSSHIYILKNPEYLRT